MAFVFADFLFVALSITLDSCDSKCFDSSSWRSSVLECFTSPVRLTSDIIATLYYAMVYLYKTIPNSSIELITTSLILKRFLIRLFVWFLITFEGDLFVRGNDIEKVNKFV